jgi:hypothetical protein
MCVTKTRLAIVSVDERTDSTHIQLGAKALRFEMFRHETPPPFAH